MEGYKIPLYCQWLNEETKTEHPIGMTEDCILRDFNDRQPVHQVHRRPSRRTEIQTRLQEVWRMMTRRNVRALGEVSSLGV